jgi:hypothetical protein
MRKHLVILVDMVPVVHESVVPVVVTFLLGLYNPPRRDCAEPAKPGLLYPFVWIPCCGILFARVAK